MYWRTCTHELRVAERGAPGSFLPTLPYYMAQGPRRVWQVTGALGPQASGLSLQAGLPTSTGPPHGHRSEAEALRACAGAQLGVEDSLEKGTPPGDRGLRS